MSNMRFLALMLVSVGLWAGVPTIDDLLNLKRPGGATISPNGRLVAYSVGETDWEQDAFVRQIWLADVGTGRTWQLTRGKKSSGGATWSPDSQWLAFTSDREGGKNQIFAIRPDGGEAVQLTKSETGVNGFDWSRDGKSKTTGNEVHEHNGHVLTFRGSFSTRDTVAILTPAALATS